MAKTELNFNHNFTVRCPPKQEALLVPLSEWVKTMDRIRKINYHPEKYSSIGWGMVGAAVSFAGVAITFPFSIEFVSASGRANIVGLSIEIVSVVAVIATTFAAWLSFSFVRTHKEDAAKLQEFIVEDMEEIRRKHTVPAESSVP